MTNDDTERRGLTRRRLLVAAGGAVAAGSALAGCGGSERAFEVGGGVPAGSVDAPDLRSYPYLPARSQVPLQCSLLSFLDPEEARAVEAFTARLIPGDAGDPGAREACVTNYIDRKLAEHHTFATPTYFQGPFAKPAEGREPGFEGDTVYVSQETLPRYGFQSSLTPQQAYRKGLANLERYARTRHGNAFADLPERQQDTILELLEAGKIESFQDPDGESFFSMLQDDANEGFLSDPLYGGNRDLVGWKLLGYPGAQRGYAPYELVDGPHDRTVQGLLDMPAMHPGRREPGVILPLSGRDEGRPG